MKVTTAWVLFRVCLLGPLLIAALLSCGEPSTPGAPSESVTEPDIAVSQTPEPPPEITPPAVTELGKLLRSIDSAMSSVSTGRSVVEVDATIEYAETTELFASRLEGDFRTPDRSQYRTMVDGGGFTLETETITVGPKSWTRVTSFVEGPWEPDSESPRGSVITLGLFDMRFDAETEEHFVLVGEEELDGRAVLRLKGGAAVVQVPNVTSATDQVNREVEYWVDATDFLVRKAVLHSEASFAVPTFSDQLVRETVRQSSDIVVTLSDYGKAVDIQAPEEPSSEEPATSAGPVFDMVAGNIELLAPV